MEAKILEERINILFGRREIVFDIKSQSMPNYKDVESWISTKYSVPSENIVIKSVQGHFGYNTFRVVAFVYHSKEEKERVERAKKIKGGVPAASA